MEKAGKFERRKIYNTKGMKEGRKNGGKVDGKDDEKRR